VRDLVDESLALESAQIVGRLPGRIGGRQQRRINASAVEAFTIGNILFQSLRLEPVEAAFEHPIIDFVDQAYQYQSEHRRLPRATRLTTAAAAIRLPPASTPWAAAHSRRLRLAAVRTREEIGGVTEAE